MSKRSFVHIPLGRALAIALCAAISAAAIEGTSVPAPLAVDSARISITGTSNVHAYTASTTTVRLTRVELAEGAAGPELWDRLAAPGGVAAFEIAIPAESLTSPREGLDKNMHKALKVKEHADIVFRLTRLEPGSRAGALRAAGVLRVAGVERPIAFDVTAQRHESTLTVRGEVPLLMTDYGITPPKAMLGMLKTDPKVTVTFETVLAVPTT